MTTVDRRFCLVRDLDTEYTFTAPATKAAWLKRAAVLRRKILVSLGLYPLPDRTLLNAQVFGRIDRDGYRVEKVCFESLPGFFCTGNLYRPRGRHGRGDSRGPRPAVLCPHGHHRDGRFADDDIASVAGRCINLARLGFIVLSTDMIGYNDSLQLPHQFADPSTPGGRRLALWGLSVMGLQTWNSIRAVDFLESLDEVDRTRIACTGASGGGTQTFMLCAVDDRIAAAAPVNMISATMQGGCLCENASGLRRETNNMELAALFAPRPLLMVSCTGDWTVNTPKVEFPAVQAVYRLFRAADRVSWVQVDAPHNYNRASREAVYGFLAHHLLGHKSAAPIRERAFTVEKREDLLVFPDKKLPPRARDAKGLVEGFIRGSEIQFIQRVMRVRAEYGPALRDSLGVETPTGDGVFGYRPRWAQREGYRVAHLHVSRCGRGEMVPAMLFVPDGAKNRSPATLVVHGEGKAALLENDAPGALVRGLLARGRRVMAIDAFRTGEAAGKRRNVNHFATYNRTDDAERVQDILTALAWLADRDDVLAERVSLVGCGKAGMWCLLAYALAPQVARAVIDAAQFRMDDDASYARRLYIPGLRRAGDVRTAAALIAPRPLFLHNVGVPFNASWFSYAYDDTRPPRWQTSPAAAAAVARFAGR